MREKAVKNPAAADIPSLLAGAAGGALRVAKDYRTGDLYVWDASVASHRQMIEALGLDMADGVGFISGVSDLERAQAA